MDDRDKAILIIEMMCTKCAFFEDCPEDYNCPPKELCLNAAWKVGQKKEKKE